MHKIIIFDDEQDLCLLLKEYFQRKGYSVTVRGNLFDYRDLIRDVAPDIIFLDNNLPGGPGWEQAANMVNQTPDTNFILMSAFGPEKPVLPANAKYQFIEKPLTFAELDKFVAAN